jgi:hypothetical protein
VAPADGVTQGALPVREVARPVRQQGQPPLQAGQQRAWGQVPHPRRGQLERQGQAVQAAADLRHGGGVLGGEGKAGVRRPRPLDEEPHGVGRRQMPGRGRRPGLREGQRRHQEGVLAGKP